MLHLIAKIRKTPVFDVDLVRVLLCSIVPMPGAEILIYSNGLKNFLKFSTNTFLASQRTKALIMAQKSQT